MVTRKPRLTIQISAQIQFEIMNFMSHLLYLNSCDNYPNKCPHNCFRLIFKLPSQRQVARSYQTITSGGRHYTQAKFCCNRSSDFIF